MNRAITGDALRSAIDRLRLAVFVVRSGQELEAYNRRAAEVFDRECLRGDLLTSRPSHPLALLVSELLTSDTTPEKHILTFPSGRRYNVEISRRSEKGPGRMLMLLLEDAEAAPVPLPLLQEAHLTEREHEVATLMLQGLSSDEICERTSMARNTLKSHVRAILAKTSCRSRTEFLAKMLTQARQRGDSTPAG